MLQYLLISFDFVLFSYLPFTPLHAMSTSAKNKKKRADNDETIPSKKVSLALKKSPPSQPVTLSSTSACDYLRQIESSNNEASPNDIDLCSLGIEFVPTKQLDKNSTLKLAVVPGEALVFRMEPNPTVAAGWSEKKAYDAISQKKPWTTKVHFDPFYLVWFLNNVRQVNSKGYPIRLFPIYIKNTNKISDANLLQLGRFIAHRIDAEPDNDTNLIISEESYFWIRNATWQELIGVDAAIRHLRFRTGAFFDGYYDKFKTTILAHFPLGTMPLQLAQDLHAPIEHVDPSTIPHRESPLATISHAPSDTSNNDNNDNDTIHISISSTD